MAVADRGWAKQRKQTEAPYPPAAQTHALTNTPALFPNLNKPADKQDFTTVTVTATNHTSGCANSARSFDDVRVRGEAARLEPCRQAHLCFHSPAWWPRRVRGLWTGVGASPPWVQDIPAAGPSPRLLGSIRRTSAGATTGTCHHGLGTGELRGLVWGEGLPGRDTGQAAQSSLYSRYKTQKLDRLSVQNYLTNFSKYSVKHSPSAHLSAERSPVPPLHFKATETQAPRLRATCPRPL